MSAVLKTCSRPGLLFLLALIVWHPPATGFAQEDNDPAALRDATTASDYEKAEETLADQVRKSLVVVRATDRTGDESGFGAGFAVDRPGLIATARHVIGDGRDFIVEMPDGKTAKVIEVFASSNQLDLAIIRIDNETLPPLSISVETISQDRRLIALGHPRGRRYAAASGTFAGIFELEGVRMLELAMPIEPGNSGGPVLTEDGQIVGLVTMKSTVKNGVGYAMPANLIREMIDEPNPIPMSRWKTIGALDARMWKPVFGGEWKRKAARIVVHGVGTSFGGRTLCLQQVPRPEFPFDLKVDVKLGDEQGAAGLVFHSDGADRHYGFYPSAGNMRLTRFDGADVGSWTILHNEPHPAYRPNDWNSLLVRIHADHFECFLNGQKVIESRDDAVPHGAIGLAAFRGTPAEFRRFQTGADLFPAALNEEQKLAVNQIIGRMSPYHPAGTGAAASVIPFGDQAADTLSAEADRMENKARRLRELAAEVHESVIRTQLMSVLGVADDAQRDPNDPESDGHVSLLHAALLISRMDNPDVDVDVYLERIKLWADEIQSALPEDADEATRLAAMDRYLFEELGVHGSRHEYYTRANSYINEVIEDREGLPITLSVVYIEVGKRLNLNIQGIGMPGHFVVQFTPSATPTETQMIDPFEHGKRLSEEEIANRLTEARFPNLPQFRMPQTPVQICERMINNLLGLAEGERDEAAVLRYLETLVTLVPSNPEYRAKRLEMRARTGRLTNAIEDANWFIEHQPDGVELERVRDLRTTLETELARQQAKDAGE